MNEKLPDERCETCKFFVNGNDAGTCHCYPPKVFLDTFDGGLINVFPAVTPVEWCGKFEYKKGGDN